MNLSSDLEVSYTTRLTHCPTVDCQPIMLDWTHACDLTFDPRNTVDLERHTPAVVEADKSTIKSRSSAGQTGMGGVLTTISEV